MDFKKNNEISISDEKKLGRGIASLLGVDDGFDITSIEKHNSEYIDNPNGTLKELDIENIFSNPNQPRKHFDDLKLHELSESIKNSGLLQPIIVVKVKNSANLGKYLIIAGERRFRASKMAGLKKIKALILNLKDEEILKNAILENIQREDLNPIEEASGYKNIIDTFNYTHDRLAKEVGKSRAHITNLLRVLTLPDDIKKALEDGIITLGHAKVLLGVKDSIKYLPIIVEEHLSVRKLEQIIAGDVMDNTCNNGVCFGENTAEKDINGNEDDTTANVLGQLSDLFNEKKKMYTNNIAHDLNLNSLKKNISLSNDRDLCDLKDKIKIVEKHLSDNCGFDFQIKLYRHGNGKCEISFKNLDDLLDIIEFFQRK